MNGYKRYHSPLRRRHPCRTLAEEWWGCPVCGNSAGTECPGDTPHEARATRARMQWWGCTEEEIPARAARAEELKPPPGPPEPARAP
jgi:hypothetical protein